MKIFNYFFIIVFILFAAVQYNDPDPYVWMPIYLFPAVLGYCIIRGWKVSGRWHWLGYVVLGLYAIYKFFDENGVLDWIRYHQAANIADTMKAEKPWIEETREFFGLIIVLSVLGINHWYGKRKKIVM